MRTLSANLEAEQRDVTGDPYIWLWLGAPDGFTTYTFTTSATPNRIWRIDGDESVWGSSRITRIFLRNHDQYFSAKDFRGYKVVIGWGFKIGDTGEFSMAAPIWVENQRDISEEGELLTVLECRDIWWRIAQFKVVGGGTVLTGTITGIFQVGENVTATPSGATAKRVLNFAPNNNEILVTGTSGTFLSGDTVTGGTSGATIVLTENGNAGGVGAAPGWTNVSIINIIRALLADIADVDDDTGGNDPRINDLITYTTSDQDPVLGILRRVLEMTNSMLVYKNDEKLHLIWLNPAPANDYEYDTVHSFWIDIRDRKLVIPNKIFVVDKLSTPDSQAGAQFTSWGVANDTTSQAAIGIITQVVEQPDVASNAEAALRAATILARVQAETIRGNVTAPMNCGQETVDWITITDTRLGVTVSGRVGRIIRRYNPRETREEHYSIECSIGEIVELDLSTPRDFINSLITFGTGRAVIPGGSVTGPLTGGSNLIIANQVWYTPAVLADWDASADPGEVDDALDQLASRTKDLEGGAFSEIRLIPKASSAGAEGTMFYDSDDDHVWVATE